MQSNRRAYILRPMEINGARIEALMKRKGWSQGRLAKESGVSQPTIWAMIHGKYRSPSSIPKVARALGVPAQILFENGSLPDTLPGRPRAAGSADEPLTVAGFVDEGMAALEQAFEAEALPFDARAAAVLVADWWIMLTEDLGLGEVQRIADPKAAARLRRALAREVTREIRSTLRAREHGGITTSR